LSNWHATNANMFIIQCPILWYAKVCALPSAHSSEMNVFRFRRRFRSSNGGRSSVTTRETKESNQGPHLQPQRERERERERERGFYLSRHSMPIIALLRLTPCAVKWLQSEDEKRTVRQTTRRHTVSAHIFSLPPPCEMNIRDWDQTGK